jgi:hypothetical protein
MGSWGYGPFDSDDALDYLADLAERVGAPTDDETFRVIADTASQAKAVVELEQILRGLAVQEPNGRDWEFTSQEAYAALGLVAAAKAGVDRNPNTGTRLIEQFEHQQAGTETPDLAGLITHCGYLVLVPEEVPASLLDAAKAAVPLLTFPTNDDRNLVLAELDRILNA